MIYIYKNKKNRAAHILFASYVAFYCFWLSASYSLHRLMAHRASQYMFL